MLICICFKKIIEEVFLKKKSFKGLPGETLFEI